MNIDALIQQYIPGAQRYSVDGEDVYLNDGGAGSKANSLIEWNSMLEQMGNAANNGQPGAKLSDARIQQIIQQIAQTPGQPPNISDVGKYLNPQEAQSFNQWIDYGQQQNADMSFGDMLAMGTFALGAGALGGAALGAWGGAPAAAAEAGTVGGLSAADAALIDAANAGLWGGAEAGAAGAAGTGGFVGGASGGGISGEGALSGLAGGGSGGGVSGAVGGGALSGAAGGGALTQAAGSAMSRILDGTATTADWTQVLGGAGSAALGVAGANAQGNAYENVADKYLAMGAPYRDKLLETYQPGYSIANSPDFMNALDVGSQAAARATSAKYGNPVDNPGAYAEMQKYITGSLALPQLNTTRSQLGTFGQLGTNIAGSNDTAAAGTTTGAYNAVGTGLAALTRPDDPYRGALSQMLLNSSKYLA